jgi:hypothetical protein
VARLRGILARDMTGDAIDQLLGDVFAERDAAEQPIPYALAEPPLRVGNVVTGAHWSDPMRPVPGCAAAAAAEIYTGPGSVGDVLARAFRATYERGR